MPTTAESLPLLIYFFLYTLNLYLVNADNTTDRFWLDNSNQHHSRQQKTF